MTAARYDGLADWYDSIVRGPASGVARESDRLLRELLGHGPGRCLDLGCGGGLWIPSLVELGWSVVGVDVSADQLRVARERLGEDVELVQADARALPFADGDFDAAVAVFVHTDLDDYEAALAEAARVLRPVGVLVHLGAHPCFVGPFARPRPGEAPLLAQGYHDTERVEAGDERYDARVSSLRARVGERHLPLARLLNAFLAAGFSLERFAESEDDPPVQLGLVARRV